MSGDPILPGATIGVFGSGQLGRMLALAARRMGYRIAVFSDDHSGSTTPAGQVADHDVISAYDDEAMLGIFARGVDVATVEFENVPAGVADAVEAAGVALRPGRRALTIAQDRALEKSFFAELGLPTAAFSTAPLADAAAAVGYPALAKTTRFGYDGKGQWRLDGPGDLDRVPQEATVIVEHREDLASECSVVVARGTSGEVAAYPVLENHHVGGILDWTVAPARLPSPVLEAATAAAVTVMEGLDLVGVACLELFVTDDGRVLANEIAPRPHNSGHLTIEAAATSQFEQQVRAVCGLPLGSPDLHRPAAMAQLLGDLWEAGEPDWAAALAVPGVSLHLYGKADARPGRKMGHLTALGVDPGEALERVLDARHRLTLRR